MENLLNLIITILLVGGIFGFLVFVHELGHFVMARLNGVFVEEFAIGFGPKIWGKKIGDTLYRINVIPLGGYVKMLGDTDGTSFTQDKAFQSNPQSLLSKSIGQRMQIVLGGVVVNFFVAVIIFYLYLALVGFKPDPIAKIVDYNFWGADQSEHLVYIGLVEDGAADKAGILFPGFILDVNGKEIDSREELSKILNENENQEIKLRVTDFKREEEQTYTLKLGKKEEDGNVRVGIFFSNPKQFPNTAYFIDYSNNKLISGFSYTIHTTVYQILGLGQLIGNAFQGDAEQLANSVGTPIKISTVVYEFVSVKDIKNIINLTALLSATLAFMNMLPIPIVDGGQFYLLILEKLRGRPLSDKTQETLGKISFVFLVGLSIFLLLKDLWQDILSRIF